MHSGQLILEARRDAAITQSELARRLGTTQSAVARLESAESNPRLETLERALEALGRELEIAVTHPDVDIAQIDSHLALTPADRLRRHDAAARNIRRLRATARRVDAVD